MFWFAKKLNGEIIVLTEQEALIHFEDNNISRRMRLQFIGTSSGKHQAEARKKIMQMLVEKRPDNYNGMKLEAKNLVDQTIRDKNDKEIKAILEEAHQKELEEAEENCVRRPRADLHYHVSDKSDFSREEVLSNIKR